MCHNILAIDEISYLERQRKDESVPDYFLDNFDCYLPKLEKDFYLRVLLKKLLFDIDILEVEYFLSFQYDNSKNPTDFIRALKYKVLPSIEKIIGNANISFDGWSSYTSEIILENDFIETEGVIKNKFYTLEMFYQWTAFDKLEEDLKERVNIILDFNKKIEQIENSFDIKKLSWEGKPSHLAFLIRNLVDEGYITPPLNANKEINCSELARQILTAFNIQKGKINTFRIYLDSESDKHFQIKNNFNNQGFHLPNSGFVG